MNFSHGTQARFYYHVLDMSPHAEGVEQQLSRAMAEYRPLAGTSVRRQAGHKSASIALTGGALERLTNDADAWARLAEDGGRAFAFLPGGDAVGRVAYIGAAKGENQQRVAGDDIVRLPVAMVSAGDIDRGVVLRALSATGTSPGAAHDNAADSDDGGVACLLCTALVGTLTVTVEHSADNLDWEALVVMTALTETGSELKTVTGTVNRYLRISWTLTGTDAAATWFAAFARR